MRVSLGRSAAPRPPAEVADEVELYAREHGRHGTVEFVQVPGGFACWAVRFTLRAGDKRLQAYREGRFAEEPVEMVWLLDPATGKPLDLYQAGAAGVRAFLERGNTWSGRGEHASVEDAVRTADAKDAAQRQATYEQARDEVRYRARHDRLRYAKQPHKKTAREAVGIHLNKSE